MSFINKSMSLTKGVIKNKKKKNKKCLRRCIDKTILDYLLNLIDNNESNDILKFNKKILNIYLYYTGLRINELLYLNKQNLLELYNNGKLNVYCKKTKDYRTVFLKGSLKDKFHNHLGDLQLDDMNEVGFINKWGNRLSIRTATEWMDPYWDLLQKHFGGEHELLSGRPFGFHSYRVNFINQVVRSSDLDHACKIIGHKNPLTTMIYFRRLEAKENEVVDILDNAAF